jgi:hypothetical protein
MFKINHIRYKMIMILLNKIQAKEIKIEIKEWQQDKVKEYGNSCIKY